MNALAFDSLAYARRLESAGFSRAQAEALAEEQAKLIDDRLATKADIEALRGDIEGLRLTTTADIESLRQATNADIESLRQATKADIETARLISKADLAEAKSDLVKWMVGTVGVQTIVILGAVAALVRLVHCS